MHPHFPKLQITQSGGNFFTPQTMILSLILQTFHRHHHHHCLPPDLEIVSAPRGASPSVDQMLVVVQCSSVEGGTTGDYDYQGHSHHYHLNLSLIHQNVNRIFQHVLCPVQIPQSPLIHSLPP